MPIMWSIKCASQFLAKIPCKTGLIREFGVETGSYLTAHTASPFSAPAGSGEPFDRRRLLHSPPRGMTHRAPEASWFETVRRETGKE